MSAFAVRDDIRITVEGVVVVPGWGYMHPLAYRDMAGEEAYQELLAKPRVLSEYTNCDCPGCKRAQNE